MRMSHLIGRRIKETPKDATLASHQFLLRGGYARPVTSGVFSILPLGKRVLLNIERIIREEMNAISGQEVLLPVVMPREMWEESGRYHAIGKEMVRFKDRSGKDFLLGMTHEEAVVTLARTEAVSYKHYPFMLYQIQTKFRDEPRARGGLIRVREFTMKDAYSFHTSQDDLARYYDECFKAYERVFQRAGLKRVVSVKSDTGMMGGSVAHEFMLVTPVGEDTLILCPKCHYSANNEVAVSKLPPVKDAGSEEALTKIPTPGTKTIADLCKLLKIGPEHTAKAVFYKAAGPPAAGAPAPLIFAVIRGDREINEVKLAKVSLGRPLVFANDADITSIGAVPGFASPLGVDMSRCQIIVDPSILTVKNLVVGANEVDQHYRGFSAERDLPKEAKIIDIAQVQEGDLCQECGSTIEVTRGIEVGNIFQLGTKYSDSMGMRYSDEAGQSQVPTMGCYGIGVGRLLASVMEESHDAHGPIWPISIAPFQVHIVALQFNTEPVREKAQTLYKTLLAKGFDVVFDDRDEKPGVQFAEADLMGVPIRLIVAPKALAKGKIELKLRDGSLQEEVDEAAIVSRVEELRTKLSAPFARR